MSIRSGKTKSVLTALIAIMGWMGLLLQLYVTVNFSFNKGDSIAGAIILYLSYFTILTNLLVAISTTTVWLTPESSLAAFFSKPVVSTGIGLYIIIVVLVYNFVLRHLWQPEGIALIADETLHSLIPALYLLYWIVFVQKGSLRWNDALLWLIYPFLYLVVSLLRGPYANFYPYPFIDVNELGYLKVFVNSGWMLLAFVIIGSFLIITDRLMRRD